MTGVHVDVLPMDPLQKPNPIRVVPDLRIGDYVSPYGGQNFTHSD
jgi:hypothetical protein